MINKRVLMLVSLPLIIGTMTVTTGCGARIPQEQQKQIEDGKRANETLDKAEQLNKEAAKIQKTNSTLLEQTTQEIDTLLKQQGSFKARKNLQESQLQAELNTIAEANEALQKAQVEMAQEKLELTKQYEEIKITLDAQEQKNQSLLKREASALNLLSVLGEREFKAAQLERSINAQKQQLQKNIELTRELFGDKGKQNTFDKIQAGEKFAIHASIFGITNLETALAIRAYITKNFTNQNTLSPKSEKIAKSLLLLSTPDESLNALKIADKLTTSKNVLLNDRYVITAEANAINSLKQYINKINSSSNSDDQSLYVGLREIKSIVISSEIIVEGRKTLAVDLVTTKSIKLEDQILPADVLLKENGLNNLSSAILNTEKCEALTSECVEAMNGLGFFGYSSSENSAKEKLAYLIFNSINQKKIDADNSEKTVFDADLGVKTFSFKWNGFGHIKSNIDPASRNMIIDNIKVRFSASIIMDAPNGNELPVDYILLNSMNLPNGKSIINLADLNKPQLSIELPIKINSPELSIVEESNKPESTQLYEILDVLK